MGSNSAPCPCGGPSCPLGGRRRARPAPQGGGAGTPGGLGRAGALPGAGDRRKSLLFLGGGGLPPGRRRGGRGGGLCPGAHVSGGARSAPGRPRRGPVDHPGLRGRMGRGPIHPGSPLFLRGRSPPGLLPGHGVLPGGPRSAPSDGRRALPPEIPRFSAAPARSRRPRSPQGLGGTPRPGVGRSPGPIPGPGTIGSIGGGPGGP
ncbi:MAG: hypothetical protein BWY88_01382 [Synergistetes bacterium ADurb.Bin520]|nr:MAG: hypothetical protein BWY88_01382 [Synergistetes bacterium ADurb.Bin520]